MPGKGARVNARALFSHAMKTLRETLCVEGSASSSAHWQSQRTRTHWRSRIRTDAKSCNIFFTFQSISARVQDWPPSDLSSGINRRAVSTHGQAHVGCLAVLQRHVGIYIHHSGFIDLRATCY